MTEVVLPLASQMVANNLMDKVIQRNHNKSVRQNSNQMAKLKHIFPSPFVPFIVGKSNPFGADRSTSTSEELVDFVFPIDVELDYFFAEVDHKIEKEQEEEKTRIIEEARLQKEEVDRKLAEERQRKEDEERRRALNRGDYVEATEISRLGKKKIIRGVQRKQDEANSAPRKIAAKLKLSTEKEDSSRE